VLLIWDFHQMQKLVWPQNYMQRAHNFDSSVCLMDSDGRFQYYSMEGDGGCAVSKRSCYFGYRLSFGLASALRRVRVSWAHVGR